MRTLLTTTAMAILLAACGGSGPEEPTAPTETPAPTEAPASQPAAETETEASSVAEEPAEETAEVEDVSALLAELPAPYNTADYKGGERVFKQCATCHRLDPAEGHRVGPNLHGFFGREAGTLDDFKYSKALKEADFVWTPAEVDAWLSSPKKYLPGNRMSFAGVPRESQRNDVIAYLLIESNK